MTTQTQPLTADDLLHLPDDGERYELVQGELRKMAPASSGHGVKAMRLGWRLAQYVATHQLGEVFAAETGFLLARNPDTVRAPDVAFVRADRIMAIPPGEGFWPEAPDLAAEVISPGDSYSEVAEKVADWLGAGTRMVLIVDPRLRTVTVYRALNDVTHLTAQDTLDGDIVVPGWTLQVGDLFA